MNILDSFVWIVSLIAALWFARRTYKYGYVVGFDAALRFPRHVVREIYGKDFKRPPVSEGLILKWRQEDIILNGGQKLGAE